MTKESSDGGLEKIARVKIEKGKEIPLTSDLNDIPSDIYGQLSDRTKESLNREDIQVVVDCAGQVFIQKMDNETFFKVMRKRCCGGG